MITPLQSRAILMPETNEFPARDNTPWELVAEYIGEEPIPCELQLSVTAGFSADLGIGDGERPFYPSIEFAGLAGQYIRGSEEFDAIEPLVAGAVRLTYGAGGTYRQIVVDLRSAKLYLGMCTSVRVEAIRWRVNAPAPDWNPAEIRVSASLFGSLGGPCDEATCTIVTNVLAGELGPLKIIVPACAQWMVPIVAIANVLDNSTVLWGSACPDIIFRGGANVTVRPSTYAIVPPFPRHEVLGHGADYMIEVATAAAAVLPFDLTVGARFYIGT